MNTVTYNKDLNYTNIPISNVTSNSLNLEDKIPQDIDVIMQRILFKKVIDKYESDTKQYPELIGNNKQKASSYFYKVLELLSFKPVKNIIFSLTSSDSLFFRIFVEEKEINLEVFYVKYDDDDFVEAVVNIYNNNLLSHKNFGSLEDIFNKTIYNKNSTIYKKNNKNFKTTDLNSDFFYA